MLKRLLVVSLLLIASIAAWADELSDFRAKVNDAKNVEQIATLFDSAPLVVTEYGVDWIRKESHRSFLDIKEECLAIVDAVVVSQNALKTKGGVKDPNASAAAIIKNPTYSDQGAMGDKNWLSQSLENLGDAIGKFFADMLKDRRGPSGNPSVLGGLGGLSFLVPIVQGILILILIVGLILVILAIRRSPRFKKKSTGGILEDDEPDRTADEWLDEAARLEALNQIREACRCLYIACLVRLDEAQVARFDRGQTNWEHQRRIELSPNMISGLTFREATQRFDLVWYGRKFDREDLTFFRSEYKSILEKASTRSRA